MGYRLDGREIGIRFPAGARDFSLLHSVQIGSGATQPPIQLILVALTPGVKRLGREADL
jgi:hypothetical protein